MYEHDENEVLRDALNGLNEDTPPMPEGLHAAWMQKLEESKMEKTRTRKSITRFLSVAAALVFVVGGTLLTRDELDVKSDSSSNQYAYSMKAAAAGGTYDYGAAYDTEYAMDDYVVEEAAEAEYAVNTSVTSGAMLTSVQGTESGTTAATEKKIIRTASLTLATQSFDASLSTIKNSCEGLGGWIESASEYTDSYTGLRTAYLTLRVPQTDLDAYLVGASELGRVTNRYEYAQDVTESYHDTQTRLNTQLALMERLQALITESADLSDLLELESQIADTQYQIDRLQSSLNSTDRQVTYSTVDITLREERTVELTDTTVTFGERIVSAIQVGCETLVDFLADTAVFLVAALPFIGIVVIVVIVIRIVRKRKK